MHSFSGFQLTHDFPLKEKSRFYVIEIEDKVLFIESKSIARKILVNYQLGKTLALSPDRQEQFFGGLPSHVNMRSEEHTSELQSRPHLVCRLLLEKKKKKKKKKRSNPKD